MNDCKSLKEHDERKNNMNEIKRTNSNCRLNNNMNNLIVKSQRITDGMFEEGLFRISDVQEKSQRVIVNERPEALASSTASWERCCGLVCPSTSHRENLNLLMTAMLFSRTRAFFNISKTYEFCFQENTWHALTALKT